MSTPQTVTKKRVARCGTCPVCFRVRKFTVDEKIISHRRFIWNSVLDPTGPYGEMIPCDGSGQEPLPPTE